MMLFAPDATASSTPYWIIGLSTSGSISFGCAFVAGRHRVPSPAAGESPLGALIAALYVRPPRGPAPAAEHQRPGLRGSAPPPPPPRRSEPQRPPRGIP